MLSKTGLLGCLLRRAHVMALCGGLWAVVPSPAAAPSSVTLAWDSTPGTNIAGYKIHYGTARGVYTDTVDVGSATNTTVAGLVAGATYYFTATAYDTDALESDYSAEVAYTNLVNLLPTVVLSAPASGSSYTAPATINLAATVSANGHTITKVQFYNGGALVGEDTSAPYTFAWSSVGAGSYNLTAQAVYDAGSTVASAPVAVTVNPVALPTIALTAPINGASYSSPATISLAASVSANGHAITKVQFYNGGTLIGEDATAPYTAAWANVAAGSYSVTAQAVYDSGSIVASLAGNVTVTGVAPPSIALTAPVDGASYTSPATINLAASVLPNGHTISKVQFYNGASLIGETPAAPYVFAWANVSAGTYQLTAQVVYDSGSTAASAYRNVTVTDPSLPTIALTSPLSGDSYAEPATIALAADVAANGHTITKVQFYNGATLLAESTAAPYAFTWEGVPAGLYSVTAQALYDADGTVVATPATNVMVVAARPVSTAPMLSAIAPQTMTTNREQLLVAFTVSDDWLAASNLTITASSTNLVLLPTSNIIFGGTETNRTLTLLPMPGQTGESDVTISVSNGSLTTNTTFHLSITEQASWNLWWQHVDGTAAAWSLSNTNQFVGSSLVNTSAAAGWKVRAAGDFNSDGVQDLVVENAAGQVAVWLMDGLTCTQQVAFTPNQVDPSWKVVGTGDFNGDGQTDLLWESDNGRLAVWYLHGTTLTGSALLNPGQVYPGWKIVAVGDFNNDNQPDLLWESDSGTLAVWFMNGINLVNASLLNPTQVDPSWRIVGTADMNGDGHPDILWQQSSGVLAYWLMDGITLIGSGLLNPAHVDPSWKVVGPK